MKVLVVARGLSGAGKSTYIKNHLTEATVCSADHFFFQEDGSYKFDIKLLGRAHKKCKDNCKEAMARGDELIAIDNTNKSYKEMNPYIKMAAAFGYEVEVVRIDCSVETAIKRNTKGTPNWIIRRMAENFVDYPGEKIIKNG